MDANTEIEIIAADPVLKAEARAFCVPLSQLAASAGEFAVREALKPLVLVYGVGEAARSPVFWQAYKVLAGLPADALRLGIEEYLGLPDSEFFPKPGPLKALCDKHAEPIYRACYRASKAASLPPPRHRDPPTEEQKAQVAQMLADFNRNMEAKSPANLQSALPSIAGKPDHTGITPQMREVLARQRGD